MSTILTTDDEVLALAEKITLKRHLNERYLNAADKLDQINSDISTAVGRELWGNVSIEFRSCRVGSRRPRRFDVELPAGSGGDLIAYLRTHIEEKVK